MSSLFTTGNWEGVGLLWLFASIPPLPQTNPLFTNNKDSTLSVFRFCDISAIPITDLFVVSLQKCPNKIYQYFARLKYAIVSFTITSILFNFLSHLLT